MIPLFRKIKRILLILLAVLAVVGTGFGIYVSDYYHADLEAIQDLSIGVEYEEMVRLEDGSLVFYPAQYDSAVIFYPGDRVEALAYIPLMEHCAQEGVLAVLMPMPFNLAVLAKDAAQIIPEQFPQVQHWYMAGHCQGGSMAASFAAEQDWVEGLILLAAYSTEDVSDIPVLSIYGSADGVMDREKYEKYRTNLPADAAETVIEGGNHAGFGLYGAQKGDGTAAISNAEQIAQTARAIAEFMK